IARVFQHVCLLLMQCLGKANLMPINPAPSCGVLNPAGRLFYAIHPALIYSAGFIPAAELWGILVGAG
ncbi:MAG: hypothetical protein AB1478_12265, partial [Nitrospirota bacterium]